MKYRYNEIYADAGERSRYETLTRRLCELGHKPGEVRYFTAPGRTELCGNHTDHQHGLVLAGSVDVDTIAAVAENGSGKLRFFSEGFPSAVLSLNPRENEAAPGSAAALVAGMIAMFADKAPLRGLDVCLSSTVLPGSGLSSSASVEVLLGEIFNEWYGLGLTAGHGSVQHIDAVFSQLGGDFAGSDGVDGRHIDKRSGLGHLFGQLVVLQHDGLDVRAVGEHGQNQINAFNGFG